VNGVAVAQLTASEQMAGSGGVGTVGAMSFEAGYALGAALLWAVSSLVINAGLKACAAGTSPPGLPSSPACSPAWPSAVIGAGIVVIVGDALRRRGGLVPAALGLMLAASWAGGEAFIRAATDTHSTLEISFGALVSSLALTGAAVCCYVLTGVVAPGRIRHTLADFAPRRAHGAFCLHGLLSFGAAYSLLFHSIGLIGLSHTIMITVFWPTLALGLGMGLAKHKGATYHLMGVTRPRS